MSKSRKKLHLISKLLARSYTNLPLA